MVLEQLKELFETAGMPQAGAEAELFLAAFDGGCQHFALDPEQFPLDDRVCALAALWADPMDGNEEGTP